ncbi:MAG: ATP-binding protein [bacterium]
MRIAIASGKGGTGKTTVAVALARLIGECAFVDCDVEAPNAHLFLQPEITGSEKEEVMLPVVDESKCTGCGECSRVCQFNAIAAIGTSVIVFPELCHGCRACVLICEPKAISDGTREIGVVEWGYADDILFYHARLRVSEPMSPPLISALKKRAGNPREFTILDCPPGTTCPMIEAVRGADYCVLVTEPTPFGIHDLEMAAGAARELSIPAGVVINRVGIGDEAIESFCRDHGLPVLARIPHTREIAEGYARGKSILTSAPEIESSLLEALEAIKRKAAA